MGLQSVRSLLSPAPVADINKTSRRLSDILTRLAKGDRLARPSADPAAFVLSERFRSELGGLEAAERGVQLGRSVTAFADATLAGVQDQVNNLRSLTLQAANSAFADEATQGAIQGAIDQTVASISSQLSNATFAGTPLSNAAFRLTDDTAGALSNVAITQTPTPVGSGIDIDVTVNSVGASATTTLTGVSGPTAFTLQGNEGQLTVNFTGTSSTQLASQINALSGQTGVVATDLGGDVQLGSVGVGSSQFVGVVNVTGTGFTGGTGVASGTDAGVTVNGVAAQASGNLVNFNANGLIGSFSVDAAAAAGTTTASTIIGGGVTIPTDASGGSITFGIPAANGSLGVSSGVGNLTSLQTGGANSVGGTFANQIAVLDATTGELASLRLNLGTVDQALSSAQSSLTSRVSSLTSSLSDLRNVDVAVEAVAFSRESLKREAQIALLRRSNINQANVLRLVGV